MITDKFVDLQLVMRIVTERIKNNRDYHACVKWYLEQKYKEYNYEDFYIKNQSEILNIIFNYIEHMIDEGQKITEYMKHFGKQYSI